MLPPCTASFQLGPSRKRVSRSDDHEEDEVADELYDSRYANGIKLAQMAMLEYCRLPDPDEASAKAFLANHLDKDVDELDMPRVRFVEADEDCDE